MMTINNNNLNNSNNINNNNNIYTSNNNNNNNNYLIQTVPTMSETFDHMIETPQNDYISIHNHNQHNNHSPHQFYNNQYQHYQYTNDLIKLQPFCEINGQNDFQNSYQDPYQHQLSPPDMVGPYVNSYSNNSNNTNLIQNNNNQQLPSIITSPTIPLPPSPPSPTIINNSNNTISTIQFVNNKKRQHSDTTSSSSIYFIQQPHSTSTPFSLQCPNSPNSTSSSPLNSINYSYHPTFRVVTSSSSSASSSSTSSQPPSPQTLLSSSSISISNSSSFYNNTEASDEEMEEQFKEYLSPTISNLIESSHRENILNLVNDYLYEELPLKSLLMELREIQYQLGNGQNQSLLNNLIELFLILDNSSNVMINFLKENGVEDSEITIDQKRLSIILNDFENGLRGKDKTIKKSTSRGLRNPPNKWTKEESSKLITLVHENGDKQWKKIALQIGGGKTGAQCAQHWKRVLCPAIRKGSWDEEEEAKLFLLVEKHGQSWKNVASEIRTRTDIQCRYQYFKSCMSREVPWTPKEDEILQKKVIENKQDSTKEIGWMDLSKAMARARQTKIPRTALECKIRFYFLNAQL
ncbi:hypothetical protein DDB_G0292782 [Dictyostelium discoideum AX4]|uniref:Myb-like protein N n=1 Tax=Dictyostelium discoideum TaxID=44689 RepID=MYBN_DICDI|nr:hypothetical protein DDB_G0292782 [Dictyostelium discoideum AX4]Q54CT1.1 RecName: Full=Myb-like protein N [Dictyostelium discoideum]EAL61065.1 hypothetical protein DDB_G0292782 [Dictyostelium discoideum AX4]|eukprot:XP_629460.1 hypothetical protein DDB_G0292782 [Dictyostelium discoideum AX4]